MKHIHTASKPLPVKAQSSAASDIKDQWYALFEAPYRFLDVIGIFLQALSAKTPVL